MRHCKDRKESKMGQSVTNAAWRGGGWGTSGEDIVLGLDVDGNVREGSESRMLESGESRDSVDRAVKDKRAAVGQWGGRCQALGS